MFENSESTPLRYVKPKDYIQAQFLERQVLKYSNVKLDTELEIFDVIIPHPKTQGQVFLHAIRCGKQNKEYIILIHGYGGSLVTFYRMLYLLSQNYYVICLDLLGMGLSSRPPYEPKAAEEALNEYIETIEEFIKAVKINQPFYLIGHSLGGYIALGYTLKYQHRVKQLFCISAVGIRTVNQEEKEQILQRFTQGNIFKRFFFKIGSKIISSRTTPAHMAQKFSLVSKLLINQYVKKQFNIDSTINKAFADYLDKIFQLPVSYQGVIYDLLEPPSLSAKYPLQEHIIEKMTIPVVFYYGEFDYMDTTAASYVCSKKPNCTFARIKRSTHHPNMQNPGELCEHIINSIQNSQVEPMIQEIQQSDQQETTPVLKIATVVI